MICGDYQIYLDGIRVLFTDSSKESARVQEQIMSEFEEAGVGFVRRVTLDQNAIKVFYEVE